MHAGGLQLLVAGRRGCTQDVLEIVFKIVPQIVQKNPRKIEFADEIFARFEVQLDVRQIVPQIVPVFVCDRTGLILPE